MAELLGRLLLTHQGTALQSHLPLRTAEDLPLSSNIDKYQSSESFEQ